MPSFVSLRLAVLVWLLRATALRCWWYWIISAVRWNKALVADSSSHQDCTTALLAARIWQTVTSGFFSPQLLAGHHQEQVAHGREDQVSFEADPRSALPVCQSHFSFLVFETALDRPARKGDLQQLGQRRFGRRITDEILDLFRERVAAHQQVPADRRQALGVLRIEQRVLDLPDDRTFVAVLDVPCFPRLVPQGGMS